jgi:hypothetical protein
VVNFAPEESQDIFIGLYQTPFFEVVMLSGFDFDSISRQNASLFHFHL